MSSIRIHLADSDHFSRAGIIGALSEATDIVVEKTSSSMTEAVLDATHAKPDVILLEASLVGSSLVSSIRDISKASPDTKIIVLTSRFSREESMHVYNAGCSGIISKSSISHELPSAVRMVSAGYQLFAQPSDGWNFADRYERRSENQMLIKAMPERDRTLISLVAAGMTNSQISRHIHVSEGSVKLHLARVMDELSVTNRVQLAVIASETGLVTSADLQLA